MKDNIAKVIKKKLCTKCAFCAAVCPENAIEIDFTRNGYALKINDHCIHCGLCTQVCSGREIINYKPTDSDARHNYYLGSYRQIFSVFSTDFNNRYNGSSGGVVSETLIYLLENKLVDGAVVTAFDIENPLKPKVYIARNRQEVLSAQGSKYSPVPLGEVFKKVRRDRTYAAVGIPCHLQALVKYIDLKGYDHDRFIKLGLFCSRTNELKATRKLLKLNSVKEKNVARIKYRGSGHPGKFQIDMHNGERKYVDHLDKTYWGHLFKNYYMPYRCWLCADKTSICADLSFGDDWARSFFVDKVGHTLVIARTGRGLGLLKVMADKKLIDGQVVRAESVISSQGLNYKMNIKNRLKITDFLGKSKPEYVGYAFKEEALSFRDEIMMFLKICLINSFSLNLMIDGALICSRVMARLKLVKQCLAVVPESIALVLIKKR